MVLFCGNGEQIIDEANNVQNNKFEKFEPLSWFSNEKYAIPTNEHNNNDDAIENFDIDDQYAYGTEQIPIDLSNDIAVNQMLADQGAAINPDAELFDVNEYNVDGKQSQKEAAALQSVSKEQQNEAIEYLPFHHTNANQRQKLVIDKK